MRQILKVLAFLAMMLPGVAAAQCYSATPLPVNTVLGRLGVSAGPCQAIPFATLSSKLTGASITLNSGNGQTAPGSMSGGNTYTFGANTDTPRFAGIGLGGAAPATGLEVYNAAASPSGNGQGMLGATSANGGTLLGQGSVYDAALANKSGTVALGIPTGTTGLVLTGTLTAASLSTAGTVAGSICATSAGLILYEAGVNCFAVSGVSVVSGKTLTVDNTIELAGTDGTKFTFPGATDTVATLGANQTVTGNKTFSGTLNITGTGQINGTAFGTFATQNFATPPAIGATTPAAGSFSTLTATTPLGLTSGGTNASTAAAARASGGLNIDQITPHGDSNYQILATDRVVATSATLTAPRTFTLPSASGLNPGQSLYVQDFKGFVSNTNTLTIARNGSDTINGGAGSQVINSSNGGFLLISDGTSNWSSQALGAQATSGVASVNGQTGSVSVVAGTGTSVSTSGGNVTVTNTGLVATSTGLSNSSGTASLDPLYHRGYIAGLTLSTAGSSATFGVAAGVATDSTSAGLMSLASAYTKTTSAWALGTAAGSLDTGAIANSTWYHVYLIKRVDTGVVDVLTSLSATAPTMPTNYTIFRRIGSMKTNGSAQWLGFLQVDECFYWSVPVQDISATALTAATPASVTLASIPSGVKVRPIVVINPSNTGNTVRVRIYSPDLADNNSNNNMVTGASVTTATNQSSWNEDQANYTNTSQQLRAYTPDANTTLSIFTNGWVDTRGRFS